MRIKLLKSKWPLSQKWHFALCADNGKVLASSENYHNKQDAYDAIRIIQGSIGYATIYDEYGFRADLSGMKR